MRFVNLIYTIKGLSFPETRTSTGGVISTDPGVIEDPATNSGVKKYNEDNPV